MYMYMYSEYKKNNTSTCSLFVFFSKQYSQNLWQDYTHIWKKLKQNLKICKKNPILIGISSKLINNIKKHVYASEKFIKMENSLLVIFGEIWPKTLYYSTWSLARFLSNFKNS